jgi:hypothetical protein
MVFSAMRWTTAARATKMLARSSMGGQLHAGDLGIDEDAAVAAGGVLDVVVVAVIFAFECGRAATLTGWSLVVVAGLVAIEVWNWFWHGAPPWVSICA